MFIHRDRMIQSEYSFNRRSKNLLSLIASTTMFENIENKHSTEYHYILKLQALLLLWKCIFYKKLLLGRSSIRNINFTDSYTIP